MASFGMQNSGTNFRDSDRTLRQLPEGLNSRVHPFFGIASRDRQVWYFSPPLQNSKSKKVTKFHSLLHRE